jgi:serine/threonine protein phosphatase PrpC
VNAVADRLRLEAHTRDIPARTLSTTLTCGLVEAQTPETGTSRAVFLNVGDSAVYVLRSGEFGDVFGHDDTEIYSSVASALPGSISQVEVVVADLIPGDVVLLCTDGLSNVMRQVGVRRQLAEWWSRQPPGLAEFYWQASFRAQSYGDDRTVICMWVR